MSNTKMRILAFDTATAACSVALWRDGAVACRRFEAMGRGQAEALAPMVGDVLQECGLAADDLDLLAVTVGPGGFTGLRIGLAMARGLAMASTIACLGLTTTEVIAAAVEAGDWPAGGLLVALDSKRSDIYAQFFPRPGKDGGEMRAVEPENLAPWLAPASGPVGVAGDAAPLAVAALLRAGIEAFAVAAPALPDAAVMAALAARRWSLGDPPPPLPTPLYLRPPDAVPPPGGGRLRP